MSAPAYIAQNPSLGNITPALADSWAKVKRQAMRHTRRLGQQELYDFTRPNEPAEVKDYRDNNRRNLTTEGVYKFLAKASRIYADSGFSLDANTISPQLAAWLDARPYTLLNKNHDVFSFFYRAVFPTMLEDPNAILVAWPYAASTPNLPPAEVLPSNEQVSVLARIIPSDQITIFRPGLIAWEDGRMDMEGYHGSASVYSLIDRDGYWIYRPFRYRSGKLEYQLELWYTHGLGEVPGAPLGGTLTRDEEGRYYYESVIRPYYEIADEVVPAFSDNQAVRVSHAYPKMIMAQIPCPAPGCNGVGKRKVYDTDGSISGVEMCDVCGGTGKVMNPGPFQVLIRPNAATGQDPGPILEYVTPPGDIVQQSYEVPWDLLLKAKRAIGLDLLENVQESGTAKSLRLQDLEDYLRDISDQLFSTMERHLYYVDGLLSLSLPDPPPRVMRPATLDILGPELLREQVKSAPPVDRYSANIEYIARKYRGNQLAIRIHELAMKFAPLLSIPAAEVPSLVQAGAYSAIDIQRRDQAVQLFTDLSARADFMTWSDQQALAEAEAIFQTNQVADGRTIQEPA